MIHTTLRSTALLQNGDCLCSLGARMASDFGRTICKPGEKVKSAGIYKVIHQQHRLPHETSLRLGDPFPNCKVCADKVQFELVLPATGEDPASGT